VVDIIKGGDPKLQGTYIHPYKSIHLAMWLDPMFSIFIIQLSYRFLSGDLTLIPDMAKSYKERGLINSDELNQIKAAMQEKITMLEAEKMHMEIQLIEHNKKHITEDQLLDRLGDIDNFKIIDGDNNIIAQLRAKLNLDNVLVTYNFKPESWIDTPYEIVSDIDKYHHLHAIRTFKLIYKFIKETSEIKPPNPLLNQHINENIFTELVRIIYNYKKSKLCIMRAKKNKYKEERNQLLNSIQMKNFNIESLRLKCKKYTNEIEYYNEIITTQANKIKNLTDKIHMWKKSAEYVDFD
jgi:hypothetical protein